MYCIVLYCIVLYCIVYFIEYMFRSMRLFFTLSSCAVVIEKKGGKAKLVEYDGFLDMFGVPQLNQSIDDTLASIIGEKMQQNFPATLREKMNDKIGKLMYCFVI
jgi:hypothetical protein